jgi:ATP-dependent Zn protease
MSDLKAGRLEWANVDHKALLLSGSPGVGKTTFARALAKEAAVPLVATSVAEWNAASYLSGTLQSMREAFAKARRLAPCVLFIDELDGISSRETLKGDYVEYWSQVVNQLLELLSDPETRRGVAVIAATNFPEKIDPAIRRSGRLDREIVVPKPDAAALEHIFGYHLAGVSLDRNEIKLLAMSALGSTGADVEAWVRRARGAARRARRDLTVADLMEQMGRTEVSATAVENVAAHEAGHVVATRLLGVGTVSDVAIVRSGGITEVSIVPNGLQGLAELENTIAVALAGRAAEELLLGRSSIGSGGGDDSDLARATRLAVQIETSFGYGAFGSVYLEPSSVSWVLIPGLLDAVRQRLGRAKARADRLLAENRRQVELVAEALKQRYYLSSDDVASLLASHVIEEAA